MIHTIRKKIRTFKKKLCCKSSNHERVVLYHTNDSITDDPWSSAAIDGKLLIGKPLTKEILMSPTCTEEMVSDDSASEKAPMIAGCSDPITQHLLMKLHESISSLNDNYGYLIDEPVTKGTLISSMITEETVTDDWTSEKASMIAECSDPIPQHTFVKLRERIASLYEFVSRLPLEDRTAPAALSLSDLQVEKKEPQAGIASVANMSLTLREGFQDKESSCSNYISSYCSSSTISSISNEIAINHSTTPSTQLLTSTQTPSRPPFPVPKPTLDPTPSTQLLTSTQTPSRYPSTPDLDSDSVHSWAMGLRKVRRSASFSTDAGDDVSDLVGWELFVESIGVGDITSFLGSRLEVQFSDKSRWFALRGHAGVCMKVVFESVGNPSVLVGWEVFVEDMGVGIITSFSNSKFMGTQYKVKFHDRLRNFMLRGPSLAASPRPHAPSQAASSRGKPGLRKLPILQQSTLESMKLSKESPSEVHPSAEMSQRDRLECGSTISFSQESGNAFFVSKQSSVPVTWSESKVGYFGMILDSLDCVSGTCAGEAGEETSSRSSRRRKAPTDRRARREALTGPSKSISTPQWNRASDKYGSEYCASGSDIRKALRRSLRDPSVLVGWEVFVEDMGVGVITSFSKSKYYATRFAIKLHDKEQPAMVTLKRSEQMSGSNFTLLRKANI